MTNLKNKKIYELKQEVMKHASPETLKIEYVKFSDIRRLFVHTHPKQYTDMYVDMKKRKFSLPGHVPGLFVNCMIRL